MGLIWSHYSAATRFRYVYWFGLTAACFWFFSGLFWAAWRDERKLPNHFSQSLTNPMELVVRIMTRDEKDKYWDCYSSIIQSLDSTGSKFMRGNILLRIPKSTWYTPGTGDVIQGIFRIRIPNPASVPGNFDWRKMLHHRNIHFYAYLDTIRYQLISRSKPGLLEKTRDQTDRIIQSLVPSERDYPVASAMLLGLRKKMDPELYQAYSGTGAVHILAVSGLHVGIIAHIFQVILGLLSYKGRKLRVIQAVSILLVIWFYTFLTGAAPSILRSALMFSMLHVSRLLQRDAPPLNVLAAAGFILLFIQPNDIYNLGFQLSFAAMAGIFLLYEPIRTIVSTGNEWLQGLWKILAVSAAAQLLIYPLIAFHFHQFAFYFWLTGLLSAPFSYLILISGMISLALYPFLNQVVSWLGLPLAYSVKWMNDCIAWVYSLPLGRIQGWWPTSWDVILMIALSLMVGYMYYQKTRFSFLVFILTGMVFFGSMIVEEKRDQNRIEIVAGGRGVNRFVWVKDQMNTILYTINEDTLRLPVYYMERYNLSPHQVVRFDPSKSIYTSDHLRLSGTIIQYKNKIVQLVLHTSDTVAFHPETSGFIVLDEHWKPKPEASKSIEYHAPDFIPIPDQWPDNHYQWHISSTPYVTIRLR